MQRAKDDIAHLYQEFGGKPQNYRELASTREAERARERWPLISRVGGLAAGAAVPPVRAGEDPTAEPLRWLAGAAPAQHPAQPQAVPERIEPTLAHPHQPEADAAAPLPWAHAPAAQGLPPETAPPAVQATQALRAADTPAATSAQARTAGPAPDQDGAGLFAALRAPQAPVAAQPPAPPLSGGAWQAPLPPVEPAAPAQQPAPVHQSAHAPHPGRPERPTLEGRSPLARLAPPEPSPAPRAGGLHNLFARLLGRDGP